MASTDGAQSLRTASSYINNLLLSRGFLRNGQPIAFATPTEAEGGVDATMAKVMNLVHDLILRRDREQATLTSLSENNSTLRTSSDAQNQTIARLETRSAELDRQLAMSTASERTSRTALRSAETRLRTLKEEMARLKLTVKEIRAQCTNDIRKRDTEMQRLKKHLEGRRGVNGNLQVGVMVITPGNNSKGSRQQHQQALQASEEGSTSTDPRSPSYSLKEETTEFLIQLSQGLSDENDQLIHLVKTTLTTLRSLSGLPEPPSPLHQQQNSSSTNVIVSLPPSYDELESSTQEVLTHLRQLLTNPSFVPLEEVEIREDEILRLREGWERMAVRWKDAVALMDGWRKRMVDTGGGTVTVNLDDLTQGLDLDVGGLGILEDHHPSGDAAESEAKNGNGDVGGANAGDGDGAGEEQLSTSDSIIDEKEALNSPEAPSLDDNASSEPSFTDPTSPPSRRGALRRRSGNARTFPPPRKISLSKLVAEGNPNDHSTASAGNTDRNARKPKVRRTSRTKSPISASSTTQDINNIPEPEPSSPPRTIAQKLALAQQEAEEALQGNIEKVEDEEKQKEETEEDKASAQQALNNKRKRSAIPTINKRLGGSKRRSTLRPDELEGLLGMVG